MDLETPVDLKTPVKFRTPVNIETQNAFTLIELLLVLAISALMIFIAAPALFHAAAGVKVRLAAEEVAVSLRQARLYAIRHNRKVAVKFDTADSGDVVMTLYRDRDRDGVRSRDINRGIDTREAPSRQLAHFGRTIFFGFPTDVVPFEIGLRRRRMTRLEDPIRFNRSNLASFSSLGTATPGTVYLTDGVRYLMAVRVSNKSARISIWGYDLETEIWKRQ